MAVKQSSLMREKQKTRYLVINADDLGKNPSVNAAIEKAHCAGILNSASIMAGGEAFDGAVELVRRLPGLSVGLHATFCDGRSVLPHSEIPGLADESGFFEKSPAKAGLKYWTQRKSEKGKEKDLTGQLEAEVEAQFDRLQAAGIRPSHVDSHHHLHVHPVLFKILCKAARKRGVRWMRMPPGPFDGFFAWASRPEWAAFKTLEFFNARAALAMGFHLANTYGLSHTGRVCEDYLMGLLPRLRGPVAEVFLHPDLSTPGGARELDAVLSGKVKGLADSCGIALAGFKDVPDVL